MIRFFLQAWGLALFLACGVAWAKPVNARADAAAGDTTTRVLNEEYTLADFGAADKRLSEAVARCEKEGCRPETLARVYVVQGMVAVQLGELELARTRFRAALKLNPNAALPARGVTSGIQTRWDEAKKGGAAASPTPTPTATKNTPVVLPDGWRNAEAFRLAMEATDAKEANDYPLCVEKDEASLKLEDQPRTHLHLSSCLYRMGKHKDALAQAQKALEMGIARKDSDLMKVARERVKQLVERMPRITFKPPSGVDDLAVTFDGREVPAASLSKKFSVDPGQHTVKATGIFNGFPSVYDETFDVKEGDLISVLIKLTPKDAQITGSQIECMYQAKSQEDVLKCLPQKRRSLVVHLGTDVGAYSDTNNVFVLTPGANAQISSPTQGWNVGANVLVDVLSAASPDIISYASPPYRERRFAGGINGGFKRGIFGAQANIGGSTEPDYRSVTGGGAITLDLADKTITPRLGLTYTNDLIGRGPFRLCDAQSTDDLGRNPCKRPFTILAPEAGVTLVLSPTMLLQLGASLQFERGDQSKPYRHVPMFNKANVDPGLCGASNTCVKPGQSIKTVDEARLALRPAEQLPLERNRYAIAGRLIKRLANQFTLRVEERLYYDSWAIFGSTTDARFLIDLGKRFRVWPHARIHAQSAANFYQLAYVSDLDPTTNAPTVPTYRTTDRELQTMATATGGGGIRFDFAKPEAEIRPALTFTADVMYSYYFASLFLRARTALYGNLAFEIEF